MQDSPVQANYARGTPDTKRSAQVCRKASEGAEFAATTWHILAYLSLSLSTSEQALAPVMLPHVEFKSLDLLHSPPLTLHSSLYAGAPRVTESKELALLGKPQRGSTSYAGRIIVEHILHKLVERTWKSLEESGRV